MSSVIHKQNKALSLLLEKKQVKYNCAEDDDEEEFIIPEDAVCIVDVDESGDCVRIWPDLMDLKSQKRLPKINLMYKQSIIKQRQFIR